MTYLLAGDSTVAPCPSHEQPMSGWGPFLADTVDGHVANHARGGHTTESFRADGWWETLLAAVRPDDRVLVQFGHNDQKRPHLAAESGYSTNLAQMVDDVRAVRGHVALCTPVEQRHFVSGVFRPTLTAYAAAVRRVARGRGVPVIDLNVFTAWLIADSGEARSRELFCHFEPGTHSHWTDGLRDDTHFRTVLARRIAAYAGRAAMVWSEDEPFAPST